MLKMVIEMEMEKEMENLYIPQCTGSRLKNDIKYKGLLIGSQFSRTLYRSFIVTL